jgi:hypothetical protein
MLDESIMKGRPVKKKLVCINLPWYTKKLLNI